MVLNDVYCESSLSTLGKAERKLFEQGKKEGEISVFHLFVSCVCRANSCVVWVKNMEEESKDGTVYYFCASFRSRVSEFPLRINNSSTKSSPKYV